MNLHQRQRLMEEVDNQRSQALLPVEKKMEAVVGGARKAQVVTARLQSYCMKPLSCSRPFEWMPTQSSRSCSCLVLINLMTTLCCLTVGLHMGFDQHVMLKSGKMHCQRQSSLLTVSLRCFASRDGRRFSCRILLQQHRHPTSSLWEVCQTLTFHWSGVVVSADSMMMRAERSR